MRNARALERATVDRAWSGMMEAVAEEERIGTRPAPRRDSEKLETRDAVELSRRWENRASPWSRPECAFSSPSWK
jgi:hypothetical protein